MFYDRINHELENWYPVYVEIGLLVALGALVVAFNVHWNPRTDVDIRQTAQEEIELEDVEQTEQQTAPPPPPQPQVPIEVPNEEIVEEAEINLNAELDLNAGAQNVEQQGPPPPPEDTTDQEPDETDPIFVAVEQMPELIGGIEALQQKARYPQMARKAGIEGRVIVQFVVNKNGEVENPHVLRGLGGGCNEEAIRVVRQAEFRPGRQRGKAVSVRMSVPIRFDLENN